jgi:hypothetical protein
MRYDINVIFNRKQLSHISHNAVFSDAAVFLDNAVFGNANFDMKPLMRASAIPSSMR